MSMLNKNELKKMMGNGTDKTALMRQLSEEYNSIKKEYDEEKSKQEKEKAAKTALFNAIKAYNPNLKDYSINFIIRLIDNAEETSTDVRSLFSTWFAL